jgi:hypothetical protein
MLQDVIDEERKRQQQDEEVAPQIELESFIRVVEQKDVNALQALVARCPEGIPGENHKALTGALWKQFDSNVANILDQARIRWGAVFPHLSQALVQDNPEALAWVLIHLPGTRKYLSLQAYISNRPGPAVPTGERAFDQGQRASFWDTDPSEQLWSVMDVPVLEADPEEGFDEDFEDPLCILMNRWKNGVGPNCLQYLALHTPAVAWVLDRPDQYAGHTNWIDGLPDWMEKVTILQGHFESMDHWRDQKDMRSPQDGLMHMAGILSTGGYWHPNGTADLRFWTRVPLYRALLDRGCMHLHVERLLDVEKGMLGLIDKFQTFPQGMEWLSKAIEHPIQMTGGDFGAPYNDVIGLFFQLKKSGSAWVNVVQTDRIGEGHLLVDPKAFPPLLSTETPARSLLDLLVLSGQAAQRMNILAQPLLARTLWDRMAQPDGLVFVLIALNGLKPRAGLDMVKDASIRNWRDSNGNNAAHWIVRDLVRQIRPSEAEATQRGQNHDGGGQMTRALLRLARVAPHLMSTPNNLGNSPTALLPKGILVDVDRELLKHGAGAGKTSKRTRARRL